MQSPLELSSVLLKNVEFTQTPPLRSPLELPFCFYKMQSSNELPTVLLKNAEFVSTPHSVFIKCVVCLNPPLSFLKTGNLQKLLALISKMHSPFEHPILFSKNAKLKQTPHYVLQKCRVCLNSPLSSYKMQSTLELSTALLKNDQQSQCHSQLSLQLLYGYPVWRGYSR